MSSRVRSPSHSSSTSTAVSFSTNAPSGNSNTSCSRTRSWWSRTPVASLGRSNGTRSALRGRRRRGPRVAAVDRVELRPEQVALEGERRHRALLVGAGAAALQRHPERVLGVAGGERQPRAEVLEPGRVDPRVVLLERRDPHLDRPRPEQLGERGGDGEDPRFGAAEVDVGVDRVADAGKHEPLTADLVAVDPERFAQPQPGLDPARGLALGAVVVEDPRDPLAADRHLGAVGEDRRVLDRDRALVVVAVRHPALKLLTGELAGVHPHVEGVLVVIALALLAQRGDELLLGPRDRVLLQAGRRRRHSSNSIPSSEITRPAPSTIDLSGESSSRIGLVLLMWTRATSASSAARASNVPPSPLSGAWPIAQESRSPRPRATRSSWRKKVPSASTVSAAARQAVTVSSSASIAGT